MTRIEETIKRHDKGYNCAQAIACTYCDLVGMDEETMLMDIKNEVYDYSKLNDFNRYFNNHEDGNASKRVVDILYKAVH